MDPQYEALVSTATTQVAASVLVSALLAPLLTSWVVKRYGDARTAQQRQPKKEAAK